VVESEVDAAQDGEMKPVARMLATMMAAEGIPEIGAEVRA
jgi:hypothetical protein